MKIRDILSAFGFDLWRSNGRWYACRPGEASFATYSAGYWRDLIEQVVPPPPVIRTPGSIRAWAEECISAVHFKAEVDPDKLAKASFAAYKLIPSEAELEAFVNACRVDRRRLMERRG